MVVRVHPLVPMQTIDRFRGRYFFLSNFYKSPVKTYDSIFGDVLHIDTVEQGYQLDKCYFRSDRARIYASTSPSEAKKLGQQVELLPDWGRIKYGVMQRWIHLKFTWHPDLAADLLDTGDAELVEGNSWGDRTWGVFRGEGQNWLGEILMEERDLLREQSNR